MAHIARRHTGRLLGKLYRRAVMLSNRMIHAPIPRHSASVLRHLTLSVIAFLWLPRILWVLLDDRLQNSWVWVFEPWFLICVLLILVMYLIELLALKIASSARADGNLFWQVAALSVIFMATVPMILYYSGVGIINATWVVVLGGSHAGFLIASSLFRVLKPVVKATNRMRDDAERRERLTYIRDELNKLITLAMTAFTALAASVGVSMTIVYRAGNVNWNAAEIKTRALTMVLAFVLVSSGVLWFIVKPYLDTYFSVRYYYARSRDRAPITAASSNT